MCFNFIIISVHWLRKKHKHKFTKYHPNLVILLLKGVTWMLVVLV